MLTSLSQAAYTMMLTILALQNTRFPSEFVAVQAMLQLGAATYCTFVCFSRIAGTGFWGQSLGYFPKQGHPRWFGGNSSDLYNLHSSPQHPHFHNTTDPPSYLTTTIRSAILTTYEMLVGAILLCTSAQQPLCGMVKGRCPTRLCP